MYDNLDPKYADPQYRGKHKLGPVPWWIKIAHEQKQTPKYVFYNPEEFGHRRAWDPTRFWQLHLV